MMNKFFTSLSNERNQAYAEAGLGQPIAHPKTSYLNSIRRHNHVAFFDPFQSGKDFQGDLQAIFIKPMTCYLLAWYHTQRTAYEAGLTAIHFLTGSFKGAGEHAEKCLYSFLKSVIYEWLATAEIYMQLMSFVMRSAIHVGTKTYQTGESLVGLFTTPNTQATPNTTATPQAEEPEARTFCPA